MIMIPETVCANAPQTYLRFQYIGHVFLTFFRGHSFYTIHSLMKIC
jgi:hypothetical protein